MSRVYLIILYSGEEDRYSIPMNKIRKKEIDLFAICECRENHTPELIERVAKVLLKYAEYQLSVRRTNTGIYAYEGTPSTGNAYYTFAINCGRF